MENLNDIVSYNKDKFKGEIPKDAIYASYFFKPGEEPERHAVLGMDVYEYSKMDNECRIMLPVIIYECLQKTLKDLTINEPDLFQNTFHDSFKENFSDTGDGFFIVFDNPLLSLIFATYFQTNLNQFNIGIFLTEYKKLFNEKINLRYALTFDEIYIYNNKKYGNAIIKNSRLLSLDRLNRFLIDANAINWFEKNTYGIESLSTYKLNHKDGIEYKIIPKDTKSVFLNAGQVDINLMHIGKKTAKDDINNIYSMHLKILGSQLNDVDYQVAANFIVTLGSLNTEGIKDK